MNFYENLEYGSTYLFPCNYMRRSLEFDMEHGHIPKRMIFDLSSTPYVDTGDQTKGFKPLAP